MTEHDGLQRSSKLLPCPFCGGEAVLDKVDEGADYRPWFWYTVYCSNQDCVCADLCHEYETEAEAIAAWNSRPREAELQAALNKAAGNWARAERTCTLEYVSDWMGWHCLSCDNINQGLKDQKPNYCPRCGRKVEP